MNRFRRSNSRISNHFFWLGTDKIFSFASIFVWYPKISFLKKSNCFVTGKLNRKLKAQTFWKASIKGKKQVNGKLTSLRP